MLGHAALGQFAIGEYARQTRTLVPETGVFTLTGQAASARYELVAAAGSFTLTGQATTSTRILPVGAGVFTVTGQAVDLTRHLVLHAEPTVAVRAGQQPLFAALGRLALGESRAGAVQAATFVLDGIDANFVLQIPLLVEPGVFTLTGQDVVLVLEAYPPTMRVFPRVGRGARSLSQGGGPIATAIGGGRATARAFGG